MKPVILALLSFGAFALMNSTAFAASYCQGQPIYVTWSSSGCTGNPTVTGPGTCGFVPTGPNGTNVQIGTAPSSGTVCTATMSCSGPGGSATPVSDSINVTSQVWNGSACVNPPAPVVWISQDTNPTMSNGSQAAGGQSFNVNWGITSGTATSCTINHQTPDGAWVNNWGGYTATAGPVAAAPGWPGTHVWNVTCTGGPGGTSNTASFTHTVTCPANTTPSGTQCVAVTAPSGSVTSNSCTIGVGASSCAMNVVWSSSNTTGTVTVQRPYAGNSVFATGPSGNQSATFSPAGSYTLNLYDGTTYLTAGTFTASCAANSTWDSGSGTCVANPSTSCAATTFNSCSLPATSSGGSAGSCASGYNGSCNYTCSNTIWSVNSNSCTLPVSSCPGTTIGMCTLPATSANNSASGSCSSSGSCSYYCNGSGAWTDSGNNLCVAPAASCTLPWGGTLTSGSTITGYSASTASNCLNVAATLGCTNGTPLINGASGSSYSPYVNQVCTNSTSGITSFIATPSRVQPGGTTTITWNTSGMANCTLTRNGATIATGISTTPSTGKIDTVNAQNTYKLSCNPTAGGAAVTQTIIVNLTAGFQEF